MTATLTPQMRARLREQLSDAAARMEAWDAPADKPRVRVPAKSRPDAEGILQRNGVGGESRSHHQPSPKVIGDTPVGSATRADTALHRRRPGELLYPARPAPLPDPIPGIATRAIDKPFRYGSYAEAKADIEARRRKPGVSVSGGGNAYRPPEHDLEIAERGTRGERHRSRPARRMSVLPASLPTARLETVK